MQQYVNGGTVQFAQFSGDEKPNMPPESLAMQCSAMPLHGTNGLVYS
jgi:hypothetical protein